MFFIYDAQDALFAFMQRGGDVLYLIGLLAFFMWFLIFERLWYFTFIHNSLIDKAIAQWESRPDKLSWNSSAIYPNIVGGSYCYQNSCVFLNIGSFCVWAINF